MRISVVLPAYNESEGIRRCLDSILAQSVAPYEIIVVDNNSTDDTAAIARSYQHVTVLTERTQGITPATLAGCKTASGDVIACFNADVVLDKEWIAQTTVFFEKHSDVGGMSGLADAPLLPFVHRYTTPLWLWFYSLGASVYLGIIPMWGGNYAVRRDIALRYLPKITEQFNHDDVDLSLWLASEGIKMKQVLHSRVWTDEVSYGYFPKMIYYFRKMFATKASHVHLGHYPLPRATSLSLLQRGWRLLVCCVPLTLYMIVSLLTAPLYASKMRVTKKV